MSLVNPVSGREIRGDRGMLRLIVKRAIGSRWAHWCVTLFVVIEPSKCRFSDRCLSQSTALLGGGVELFFRLVSLQINLGSQFPRAFSWLFLIYTWGIHGRTVFRRVRPLPQSPVRFVVPFWSCVFHLRSCEKGFCSFSCFCGFQRSYASLTKFL